VTINSAQRRVAITAFFLILKWGRHMALQLEISESIKSGLRLPESEMKPRLRLELALALYSQDILSLGKAADLAEVSRYQFGAVLGSRGVPRHFSEEDLALDLSYARGQ
jgi:predicted HTH domain antitoxin